MITTEIKNITTCKVDSGKNIKAELRFNKHDSMQITLILTNTIGTKYYIYCNANDIITMMDNMFFRTAYAKRLNMFFAINSSRDDYVEFKISDDMVKIKVERSMAWDFFSSLPKAMNLVKSEIITQKY